MPEAVRHWSLAALREKNLVEVGARVGRRRRYLVFQRAEAAVWQALFAGILRRIDDPRPRPTPLA